MKWMFQLVALIAAVLLQAQAPSWSWLGGMKCPFVLSCVLYYALAHERGWWWMTAAVMGGLFHDAMSQIPLGYSCCLFLVLGWVATRFRRRLVVEAAMTSIVLGTILNVFYTVGLLLFLQHAGLVDVDWLTGLVRVLAAGFLGVFTSPIVCGVLGSLEHSLGNRERSSGYA